MSDYRREFVMSAREVCLSFIVLLSAWNLSFAQDSFEPDNSYSNANPIATDGQLQSHSIDPAADVDWLTFTLDASTNAVVIETSGAAGDTVIWLYDDQLNDLSYDDDGGAERFSRIQTTLPAGTYYTSIQEYNDKVLLPEYFVSVLAYAPEIVSVSPNAAAQRDRLEVTITGRDTVFYQGSSTITNVWFSQGDPAADIYASSFAGIDANSLTAIFDIPTDAPPGKWDVHVSDSVDGQSRPLTNGFTVYIYPDLNADGKVDLHDFGFFSSRWLEERVTEDIAWVYIDNDPGVSGHEGFTGEMSKYETTNAQYCLFLNAGLASGDVVVDGSFVEGSDGSNSGADFVGEPYYDLAGSGYTYNGATNGGAARINYNGGVFTVDSDFDSHPVTYVSWYGSTAFCNYYGYRLPTEWEWQAVADHEGESIYGCGTSINNSIANYYGSNHPDGTTVVGSFGAYGYGMADMAGNVWEWTDSIYSGSYRVLCGGGWRYDDYVCAVSRRGNDDPRDSGSYLGFRACR